MSVVQVLQILIDVNTDQAEKKLTGISRQAQNWAESLVSSSNAAAGSIVGLAGPAVLGALAGVLAKITAESLQFGRALYQSMIDFRVETGASQAELEKFSIQFREIHQQTTQSYQDIGGVLTFLRQSWGDLGSDTEKYAKQFLEFQKINELTTQDLSEVKSVIFGYGLGIENAGSLMDRLTVAHQKTGVSVTDLAHNLNNTQEIFQSLGLSVDQSIALLAQLERQGISTSTIFMAVRRMMEASVNPTQLQKDAMKTLGVPMNEFGQPIGGGVELLKRLFDVMSTGKHDARETAAALDIVGERIGHKFIRGLHEGKEAWQDLITAMEQSQGKMHETGEVVETELGRRWEKIKREYWDPIFQFWGKFLNDMLVLLLDFVEAVAGGLSEFTQYFSDLAVPVMSGFGNMIDGLKKMWDGFLGYIMERLALLMGRMSDSFRDLPKPIQEALNKMLPKEAKDKGYDTWDKALGEASSSLSKAALPKSQEFEEGWNQFKGGALEATVGAFSGGFHLLQDGARKVANFLAVPIDMMFGTHLAKDDNKDFDITGKGVGIYPIGLLESSKRKKEKVFSEQPDIPGPSDEARRKKAMEDFAFHMGKKKALQEINAQQEANMIREFLDQNKSLLHKDQIRDKEIQIAQIQGSIAQARRSAIVDIRKLEASETQEKLLDLNEEERRMRLAGVDRVTVAKWAAAQEHEIRFQQKQKFSQMEAEITGLTKSRWQGELEALEVERQEALHKSDDRIKTEELFNAKRDDLLREQYKASQELQANILNLSHQETKAKLLELQLQKDDMKRQGYDRIQIEKFVQESIDNLKEERYKKNRQVENQTLQMRGSTRELRVRSIEDSIRDMRDQEVDEPTIQKNLAEMRKQFLRDEAAEAKKTTDALKALNAERNKGIIGVKEAFGNDSSFNWIGGFSDTETGGSLLGSDPSLLLSGQQSLFDRDTTRSAGLSRIDSLKSPSNTNRRASANTSLPSVGNTLGAAIANATYSATSSVAGGTPTERSKEVGNKGPASFSADKESNLKSTTDKREEAAQSEKDKGIQVTLVGGPIELVGELKGKDGETATVHGQLSADMMMMRLMGDNPALPGVS